MLKKHTTAAHTIQNQDSKNSKKQSSNIDECSSFISDSNAFSTSIS